MSIEMHCCCIDHERVKKLTHLLSAVLDRIDKSSRNYATRDYYQKKAIALLFKRVVKICEAHGYKIEKEFINEKKLGMAEETANERKA